MPTNYTEGTPRDPNIAKQLNKLYRANSAPESNTYGASRSKLESSFRAEPSARPSVQINRQTFTENVHSASRPQGYEDKATQARQQARREYLQRTGQIQEIARGARNPSNFISKTTPLAVLNSPTNTPRPAIPGASLASGVASLGLGFLVDKYATPYLMNAAQNAGGILSAELHYKLGNISESELAEALRYVREGKGARWGDRVNQIRTIQNLAKRGIKLKTTTPVMPFTGGQTTGVSYTVVLNCVTANGQTIEHSGTGHWGKIGSEVIVVPAGTYINGDSQWIFQISAQGLTYYGSPQPSQGLQQLRPDGYLRVPRGFEIVSASIARVIREDGQPDVLPTQPLSTTKYTPVIPSANNVVYRQANPIQTPPLVDKPPESNKAKSTSIVIPAGSPVTISSDSESLQLTPSKTAPSTIEIPHPRTVPQEPGEDRKTPPLTISSPTSPDIKLETFGSSPVTIAIPGYNPITVTPQSNKPQGALPIQDVQRQYQPVSSTSTPTKPGAVPTPTPTTPATPEVAKPATTDDLEQFKKDLEKLLLGGTVLAGLTPAIQTIGEKVTKIGENTTPEALTTAAAAGTCRTTQPGGCTSKALDDAVGRVNQNTNQRGNLLDQVNAAANAEQIKRLDDITNRIGAQLPGGLAGKLSRFVNWAAVDRITNIVTMFGVLHNVMMLSNSVKETFLDVLDNLLQTGFNVAPNLFKKADENEAIDAREYIGRALNTFFGGLFGVSEWTALKAQWKAYSTIYSSSAQAYNNLREIHNDSQELLNMARNYTAELGNALVDEGVISEDNWQHKDDKKRIKSKVLGKLERMGQGLEQLDNKLEAIEQVTSLLLNITNTAKEIKENIEAIDKGVKDANEAAKKDRDAKIEGLELPNFSLEDLF